MQYSFMDKILIDIYNIKNIESITISDMNFSSRNSSKVIIVPNLLVIYDGGKTLSLCSKDKYFNTYVKKVVQVYNDEKNNDLEGSLTDPFKMRNDISIDDHSKKILESGELEQVEDLYKFYSNKDSYDYSLLNNKDNVILLLPIVKYHLKDLLKKMNMTIIFNEELSGYRNRFVINGKLDGIPLDILLNYDNVENNTYLFKIGGLFQKNREINMNIKFLNNRITVDILLDNYNFNTTYTYLISNNTIKMINETIKDDETKYYENIDLNECDIEYSNLVNLDNQYNHKWFKLPWNAYYGMSNKIIDLNENEKIVEISNMYLWVNKNECLRKEYYSRSYKKNNTAVITDENLILDQALKDTKGIYLKKGIYLLETSFLDTLHSSGYYNELLENKYFYHIGIGNTIKDINKEKLETISKNDGVLSYGDVNNTDKVLKMLGGKI